MIYSDFGRWPQKQVRRLINFIVGLISENEEKNLILLTSNSLMVLAHAAEFLNKISYTVKLFKKQSMYLLENINLLADKIVDNTADELIESIFLDLDFKNRTLFNIITKYSLSSFIASGKVMRLLDAVWEGVHANDCDGNFEDFSLLTFLARSTVNHIPGKKLSLRQLLTNDFVTNIKDLKFWFQYKYRRESVAYIFGKELF